MDYLLSQKEANKIIALPEGDDMSQFLVGFLGAVLWTCGDMGLGDRDDSEDTPLDENYSIIDIESASQLEVAKKIRPFFDAYQELWNNVDYHDERAGHDLMLVMAGHGVGFSDRDELQDNDIGDVLTEAVDRMFDRASIGGAGDGEYVTIEIN